MIRIPTLAAAMATCIALPATAATPHAPVTDPVTSVKTFTLPDGGSVSLGKDGIGWRSDATGRRGRPVTALQQSVKTGLGDASPVGDLELQRRFSLPQRGRFAPGRVLVWTSGATPSEPQLSAGLRAVGARRTRAIAGGGNTFLIDLAGDDPVRAAAKLRSVPGVLHAEPDFYVTSMATEPRPLPERLLRAAPRLAVAAGATNLPANYGLTSSLQSHLNASGVDAVGAYAEIARRFNQLPGQGMIVTNVSIGDLTDQAMADAGDPYVQFFGATTRVIGGQRYLDFVSLPLIPTFTVAPDGAVDPLGTVEFVDPYLGEVLLDFSVMAPLPHDRQRADATGVGATDLLGIAPGAQYRLVVPQEPTISNILVAM